MWKKYRNSCNIHITNWGFVALNMLFLWGHWHMCFSVYICNVVCLFSVYIRMLGCRLRLIVVVVVVMRCMSSSGKQVVAWFALLLLVILFFFSGPTAWIIVYETAALSFYERFVKRKKSMRLDIHKFGLDFLFAHRFVCVFIVFLSFEGTFIWLLTFTFATPPLTEINLHSQLTAWK